MAPICQEHQSPGAAVEELGGCSHEQGGGASSICVPEFAPFPIPLIEHGGHAAAVAKGRDRAQTLVQDNPLSERIDDPPVFYSTTAFRAPDPQATWTRVSGLHPQLAALKLQPDGAIHSLEASAATQTGIGTRWSMGPHLLTAADNPAADTTATELQALTLPDGPSPLLEISVDGNAHMSMYGHILGPEDKQGAPATWRGLLGSSVSRLHEYLARLDLRLEPGKNGLELHTTTTISQLQSLYD